MPERDLEGAFPRLILYAYPRDLDVSTIRQQQARTKKQHERRTDILQPIVVSRHELASWAKEVKGMDRRHSTVVEGETHFNPAML